ncbi:MAG TPA: NAD-dependent epimerase/dehydratase family protein, partial [Candidatus Elarobacter sp.]
MKVLVIGGDGYCGWATSLYLSMRGHDVTIVDNLIRRAWDREHGLDSLVPIASTRRRIDEWTRLTGRTIAFEDADVTDYAALCRVVRATGPAAVVHFGQQRSAPFSMIDRDHAVRTLLNNTVGNLNVLWALHEYAPNAHLVKLGTMGEYGTPNIDVEEGFITIEHKGRTDTL